MIRHGLLVAAATLLTVVFLASCGKARPPTPTPEPVEGLDATKPAPTASFANTPTPDPTATATATSTLDVTKTPVSSPVLSPALSPSDGLWAGELVPEPGHTGVLPPWLAMRVRPGNDPDEDLWRLESGPWPNVLPPVSLCNPQRQPGGWELSNCTGITWDLTAFLPAEGDGGLEITVQGTGFAASGTHSSDRSAGGASVYGQRGGPMAPARGRNTYGYLGRQWPRLRT